MVGDRAKAQRRLAFDQLGTHVRSHDDNRVSEIDLLTKAVGDFALFQNLEQQMHDIRMSLFDLIEEHNRVGAAANSLGKLTDSLGNANFTVNYSFKLCFILARRLESQRAVQALVIVVNFDVFEELTP